jgi:hypothetical protein
VKKEKGVIFLRVSQGTVCMICGREVRRGRRRRKKIEAHFLPLVFKTLARETPVKKWAWLTSSPADAGNF